MKKRTLILAILGALLMGQGRTGPLDDPAGGSPGGDPTSAAETDWIPERPWPERVDPALGFGGLLFGFVLFGFSLFLVNDLGQIAVRKEEGASGGSDLMLAATFGAMILLLWSIFAAKQIEPTGWSSWGAPFAASPFADVMNGLDKLMFRIPSQITDMPAKFIPGLLLASLFPLGVAIYRSGIIAATSPGAAGRRRFATLAFVADIATLLGFAVLVAEHSS